MAREKVFDYPNRRKSSSRATKWIVVALLLVSVVLMVAAMSGFRQRWQVEVEVDPEDWRDDGRYRRGGGGTVPAPA